MFAPNTLDSFFASLLNHQQIILTMSYEPIHIVSLADWLHSMQKFRLHLASSVFVDLLHTNTIRTSVFDFQLR